MGRRDSVDGGGRLDRLWWATGIFLAGTLVSIAVGTFLGIPLLQFTGSLLLASTFLPMPADAYVLHISPHHSAWFVGLLGGLLNAIAVIGEKAWVTEAIRRNHFRSFLLFFSDNRFTTYCQRFLFATLVVSGFSLLPYEPFRLVAIVSDYGNVRYFLATALGRGLRYYMLAAVGHTLFDHQWLDVAIALSLGGFIIGAYKTWRRRHDT